MITRQEIAKLTPKGRTQLFDDLCGALFPTQGATATALEVTRRTIINWRQRDEVPLMALYALHGMAEAQLVEGLGAVITHLDRIANVLAVLIPAGGTPAPRGSADKIAGASAGNAGLKQ
jgi:hypothetical protein